MNFCSLSSGSSGNCYFIGNESHGILIDAGISATSIRKFLKEMGISIHSILGILVTHKHSDHVMGLEVITRKYSIPIYTTKKIRESIVTPKSKISSACLREIDLQKKLQLSPTWGIFAKQLLHILRQLTFSLLSQTTMSRCW